MTDERKPKRPWTMSDAERDGRGRRDASASGVPIHPPDEDDFTPVSSVMDRLEGRFVLTERERVIFQMLWQHTANMELRARKRSDSSETSTLIKRIDALEETLVETVGRSGNNGKVGTLKERMDKLDGRRWAVVMWIAGLAFTIVTAAVAIGVWKGSVDTDIKTLKERASRARNNFPPEYPAPFPTTKE